MTDEPKPHALRRLCLHVTYCVVGILALYVLGSGPIVYRESHRHSEMLNHMRFPERDLFDAIYAPLWSFAYRPGVFEVFNIYWSPWNSIGQKHYPLRGASNNPPAIP
jgi:hypothetical protein